MVVSSDNQESGQAFVEYILLASVLAILYLALVQGLMKMNIQSQLMTYLTSSFSAAYQYGNKKTKGFDNGGPYYHPRVDDGGENFRIFLNPDD